MAKQYDIDTQPAIKSLADLTSMVGKLTKKSETYNDRQRTANRALKTAGDRLVTFKDNVKHAASGVRSLNTALDKMDTTNDNFNKLNTAAGVLGRRLDSLETKAGTTIIRLGELRTAAGRAAGALEREKKIIGELNSSLSQMNQRFKRMVQIFDDKNQKLNLQQRAMLADARAMGQGTKSANLLSRTLRRLRDIVGTFAGYGALFLITNELRQSIGSAKEYAKAISEIRTISDRAAVSSQEWTNKLLEQSNAYGFTFLDQAEAAYQSLSNQVTNAGDTFAFLRSEAALSMVAVSSLEAATNSTTATLNAFGDSAGAASRVNAILFKTVEEGRIRLEDMANTIGRVSILSSQLNISFTEQQAALTQLTKLGVRTEEAMTLLRNVELKLLKPSERMSELFKEWGFTSGQAAVETLGLAGVMEKFVETAKQNGDVAAELGDIFNRLRAIVGVAGLTQASLTEEMEKFENASESALGAFLERINSIDTRANRQIQQFKNTFVSEFGAPILKVLVETAEGMGGMEAATIQLIRNLKQLVTIGGTVATALGVLATGRGVYAQVTYWTNQYRIATLANTAALSAEQVALVQASRARIAYALTSLGVAGGVALIAYQIYQATQAHEDYASSVRQAAAEFRNNFGPDGLKAYETLNVEINNTTEAALKQTRAMRRAFGESAAAITRNLNALEAANDSTINALDESISAYVDKMESKFQKILRESAKISAKLANNIAQGTAATQQVDLSLRVRRQVSNINQGADPLMGYKKLFKQLEAEAFAALDKGDKQRADNLFAEVDKLVSEYRKRYTNIKAPTLPIPTIPANATPMMRRRYRGYIENIKKQNAEIKKATADDKAELNRKFEEGQIKFYQRRNDKIKEYIELLKKQKAAEDKAREVMTQKFKTFENIFEQVDEAKTGDEVRSLTNKFKTASAGVLDPTERLKFIRDLNQKALALDEKAEIERKRVLVARAKETQEAYLKTRDELIKRQEEARRKLNESLTINLTDGEFADRFANKDKALQTIIKDAQKQIRRSKARLTPGWLVKEDSIRAEKLTLREAEQTLKRAMAQQKTLKDLYRQVKDFNLKPTDKKAEALMDTLGNLPGFEKFTNKIGQAADEVNRLRNLSLQPFDLKIDADASLETIRKLQKNIDMLREGLELTPINFAPLQQPTTQNNITFNVSPGQGPDALVADVTDKIYDAFRRGLINV
ncbi:MAG: phage tail tape measure protein [Acidobacteria bacterium]|nr:phage tail tape measure protein [Acidobacteriota bacterium]|tara:strand:+ start:19469 stop:23068 length:3600 start_codon:yes stop_codon:yes gene_type:complete